MCVCMCVCVRQTVLRNSVIEAAAHLPWSRCGAENPSVKEFSTSHANLHVADSIATLGAPAAKKEPWRRDEVEAQVQHCVPLVLRSVVGWGDRPLRTNLCPSEPERKARPRCRGAPPARTRPCPRGGQACVACLPLVVGAAPAPVVFHVVDVDRRSRRSTTQANEFAGSDWHRDAKACARTPRSVAGAVGTGVRVVWADPPLPLASLLKCADRLSVPCSVGPRMLLLETQRGLASKPRVVVVPMFKTCLVSFAFERAM